MRIRKNAKISPLVYMKTCLSPGTVIETYDCKFNQSPWDVMDLISRPPQTPPSRPSAPSQVQENNIYVENASHLNIFPLVKRKSDIAGNKGKRSRNITVATEEAEPPRNDEDEPAVVNLCGKKDGKGRPCLRAVAKGSSLCERHSSMARNSSNTVTSRLESITDEEGPSKDPHKKAPTDYCCDTVFRPRWGRKRGRGTSNEDGGDGAAKDSEQHLCPSLLSDQFNDDASDDEEDDDSYRRKKGKRPTKSRSLKSL